MDAIKGKPKLKVTYRPVKALVPYLKNPRTHSPSQIEQIARSIREFGWTNPVLVDGDDIIAGHGRVLAAELIGMNEVPTIELSGLSDAQKRAYIIADNQLALNAGWDQELLRLELGELRLADFDLSLLGFNEFDLANILADRNAGLTDPDEVPPTPDEPTSRPGDLWLLGRHHLLCGDATKADDVTRALAGVKPHLMVTDPPYGVDYDPKWRDKELGTWSQPISVGKVQNDDRSDWSEAYTLSPSDVAYVWAPSGPPQLEFCRGIIAGGYQIRMQIIWAKSHYPIGRGNYHVQHEPCWYAVRKGKTAHWNGDRTQSTLWQIANMSAFRGGERKPEDVKSGHGTQKPVECMRRPIENNSSPGQAVYEPFCGSGTTIIAAEMTGRTCHAIEILDKYCDVSVERWQNFTGQEAHLAGDGRSFSEMKAVRLGE